MDATVVLGMHRSGTSCLTGMLVAAGGRTPGPVVRNWDNRHGHHEATAVVRLNESVLAHSGAHWLAAPATVRWTAEQAQARDALATPGSIIKDPRCLLVLPFWHEARPRFVGIVRHPIAVVHSLIAWRGMPGDEGLRLWLAHNRPLLAAHRQGVPVLDFDLPAEDFCAAVARTLDLPCAPLLATYDRSQVHHDGGDATGLDPTLVAEALAVHRDLLDGHTTALRDQGFPWAQLRAMHRHLATGQPVEAEAAALEAITASHDAGAALVPIVAAFLRQHDEPAAQRLIAAARPRADAALCDLLTGKAHLAAGDAAAAVVALERPSSYWESRHLLAQALRRSGRAAEAVAQLTSLLPEALYPHRLHGELAEWAVADGDQAAAVAHLAAAIAAAPQHRRGRLRTRRAAVLRKLGRSREADAELAAIPGEDPAWITARASAPRPD